MGSFVFQMATQNGWEPDGSHDWVVHGPCRARMTNDGNGADASLVDSPAGLAVGLVRLDNRHEISQFARCDSRLSDLAIIVAALARHGPSCIRRFVGDFSFVFWDADRRAVIAARDALGMRVLYRSDYPSGLSFASRASLIGADRPWSLEFIADCLEGSVSRTYTLYDGVLRVPHGTYQIVKDGRSTAHRYWSPHQFDTIWTVDPRAAVEQFATLFKEAMCLHLTDERGCWSQLSGGVDSSSIVSMAGWLAKVDARVPELRGTVTFVDTVGIGDERAYSNAVIRDWPVRNEQIVDYGMWRDGEEPPPDTDEFEAACVFFARDQVVSRLVRSTGSRVLFTGAGPDFYLHGNSTYLTDWISRGRIRDAVREMYRESVQNKSSFWSFLYHQGVKPLLPDWSSNSNSSQWPDWVHPRFARQFPVNERHGWGHDRPSTIGRLFVTQAANIVDSAECSVPRGLIGETLDVRCPYFHRPLVEFCLQLPPEMKVTDGKHKWILREAMRGILPEEVRKRTSKGFINVSIDRTYAEQHARLDSLLERSVLGEMGCIDVSLARKALAQRTQPFVDISRLEHLLLLETWLTVKSGRWTASDASQFALQ